MRKTLFMLLACMFCIIAQAQTKVEVTLTDGKVVKGTTTTLFSVDDANAVKVKNAKGEKLTYKTSEVKSLRAYDDKSQKWYTFEVLKAQKALPNVWNKKPKPYSDPVFLQVVYEGKNVTGYVHNISTQTNTKTLQLTGTGGMLYFKLKNEDVARAFWMSAAVGWRAELKLVFKDFPVMKPVLKELDSKSFYADPFALIKTFDGLLDKN